MSQEYWQTLLRTLVFFLPFGAVFVLWKWRMPTSTGALGALLAFLWNLLFLLFLNVGAQKGGGWSFHAYPALFYGFPIDLWIAWALFWGVIPWLAFPTRPLLGILAFFLLLDVLWMPRLTPWIRLNEHWLLWDSLGLLLCLLPSQGLARWSGYQKQLAARLYMIIVLFVGFLLFLPLLLLQFYFGNLLEHVLSWPRMVWFLAFQVLFIPLLIGLSAVQEFYSEGQGTPLPMDPPKKLIMTGIYSYCANPMQASILLVYLLGSLWLWKASLLGVCVVLFAYSEGLAKWDEEQDLSLRFGEVWLEYTQQVRRWIPRWKPFFSTTSNQPSPRIYIAQQCGKCSEFRLWLEKKNPIGLEIRHAEDHPTHDCFRVTYTNSEGKEVVGVVAFARCLEHIHFGWAVLGFLIRLPLLSSFLQRVFDVFGFDEQLICRTNPSSE